MKKAYEKGYVDGCWNCSMQVIQWFLQVPIPKPEVEKDTMYVSPKEFNL